MAAQHAIFFGVFLGLSAGVGFALAQDDGSDRAVTPAAHAGTDRSIVGLRVYDRNAEWVGKVAAVQAPTAGETPRVVIEMGGFLGLGQRPVAIDARDVAVRTADAGSDFVVIAPTRDQLEALGG